MTIRDHHPHKKKRSKRSDERETPDDLFHQLNERYRFTIDAAASRRNHKVLIYWTRQTDGLKQNWSHQRLWINPPFSNITPWVEKALLFEAALAVLLVPAWTDRKWFQKIVQAEKTFQSERQTMGSDWVTPSVTLEFLPGRLRFGKPGSREPDGPAPFGCMLMVFERADTRTQADVSSSGVFKSATGTLSASAANRDKLAANSGDQQNGRQATR